MRAPAPWAIAIAVAAAFGAIALIAFSVTRPEPPGYPPTPKAQPFAGANDGSLVFTVDASDERAWRHFSFETGTLVDPDRGTVWDLAFRRFHMIANGGAGFEGRAAIADVGDVSLEAAAAPAPGSFVATEAGGDSTNAAVAHWYRYGFTSHLLTPLDRTYVVRNASGDALYALRILGYYCPGARPGCMTIRYRRLD